ncbi:MAG: HD domain-containing phosphohydrolase [Opitutaceae bacterium]|jgi:response regulator RpfG family c-di-GMP phosphodiesterase
MSSPTSQPVSTHPILVVDDEVIVLAALKETLERERYHVVACSSPAAAVEALSKQTFAVIISDQRMPVMSGLEFLTECKKQQPNATRVLITAVLSLPTIIEAINKGEIFRFVAKPWLREELTTTIRNAYQRYELIMRNGELSAETRRLNDELRAANTSLEQKVHDLESQKRELDGANKRLLESYDHSLELCTRVLSTYDEYLGGQTKEIVDLALNLCQSNHFKDDEKAILLSAARLCDLGLIGVSRELLRAFRQHPERLTERERQTLHSHPIYSQTLAAYVDPRPGVGEVIRSHHERFDGEGYPDSLSGAEIPWLGRVLGVAVHYVETGLPRDQAIERVLAESGKGLDPEAVRLFLQATNLMHLPKQVKEVLFDELQPGMVLATGLHSPHGMLLISEGQPLNQAMITKIRNHNLIAPISQRLLVYT